MTDGVELSRPFATVQSVLFQTSATAVQRLVRSVAAAGRSFDKPIDLALGDCSPAPLSRDLLEAVRREAVGLCQFDYSHFGSNLGHGRAQNRLASTHRAPLIVLLNPDTVLSPRALRHLLAAFDDPSVGAAEGRQLPVESPKLADSHTGDAPWGAGCLLALRREAFEQVRGFERAFFLHDDDVDLAWRLRRAGWKIRYVPKATAFHHRALDSSGFAASQDTEAVMMRVGELLLAGRGGRSDVVADKLRAAEGAGWPEAEAAARYRSQATSDQLPSPYGGAAAAGVLLDRRLRRF